MSVKGDFLPSLFLLFIYYYSLQAHPFKTLAQGSGKREKINI